MDKKHLATITILIKDRHSQAPDINQILTDHGHIVLARLGVNLQPKCIENCMAMITLATQGTAKEISSLTKELDEIYGIVAKASVMTE
jgi:putative iron-only hydrogenase system regulator